MKKITALTEAIYALRPFVRHARYCKYNNSMSWDGSNPDSDYCTYNLEDVVKQVKVALKMKNEKK